MITTKDIKLTILYTVIILFNIVTVTSPVNFFLTFAELAFVFFLLLMKRIRDAFFWHTVFTITCLSATNASGMEFDNTVMFSYSRFKIVGPIGVSYVISIIIFLLSFTKKTQMPANAMFKSLYHLLLFLLVDGVVIGAVGLFFSDYFPKYFLFFSVFSVMVVINCLCFIKNFDIILLRKVYESSMPLLASACIAGVIAFYILGVSTTYGGLDDIILVPDLTYYGIILLFLVFLSKNKWLPLVGLLCYFVLMIKGINGKQIIGTFIGILFFLYFVLFSKQSIYSNKVSKKMILTGLVIIVVGAIYILSIVDIGFLADRKLGESLSLLMYLGDLQGMDQSPYVRVASFLNIMNDGLKNPIHLLFGNGYGGYFTDSLHLLYSKIDMYGSGGFPQDAVHLHKLPTGHDTFVVVPLLNGLVGLVALIVLVVKYAKKTYYSPFAIVALLWLLLVYYFNSQLAITGLFFLFAAEYDFQKYSKIFN